MSSPLPTTSAPPSRPASHGSSVADGPSTEASQRLASLGRLAAQVAHELNNPLDGILRYINLALRTAAETGDEKLNSYLRESRTGLLRMVQIVGDLLEYSRSAAGNLEALEVNELIDSVLKEFADAAERLGIVVAVDAQSRNMPTVAGVRLHQVLTNLVRNAIEAMPGGGRLTVTSGVVGEQVVVRVADTGVGLPSPIERIFEPFFTTKPPEEGTGLGLAICKDYVEAMGGTIVAENNPTGGATMTVKIPMEALERSVRRRS